jgi:hypothetical protein
LRDDEGLKAPPSALVLGAAGLIPFVGLAVLVLAGRGEVFGLAVRPALLLYGAIIASFLGGIRWGLAAARNLGLFDYALSVVPSLLAWAALALPAPWDLRGLGLVVLAWGLVDQDLPRRGVAPAWLGRLRLALSAVAGLSLIAASSA